MVRGAGNCTKQEVSMDLITSSAMHTMKLSMDGLLQRHEAISSNIANAMTPGYKRQEVSFEGQLNEMLADHKNKEYLKSLNSIKYNPASLTEVSPQRLTTEGYHILTPQQKAYISYDSFAEFRPQILADTFSEGSVDGNNVELEKELMDMSKTGTQYTLLSNLERREYAKISEAIRGQ